MKMISHMAIMACSAGFLAVTHSLFELQFPILLKGDAIAPDKPAESNVDSNQVASHQPQTTTQSATPIKSSIDITVAQSFEHFGRNKPFIDARHLEEFEAGHVPNAYQLSADELLQGKGQMWLGALDKNDVVVIYCGGGACDASHNLYNYLTKSFGFTKCLIMTDGLPGWTAAGHPVDTGAPAIGNEP